MDEVAEIMYARTIGAKLAGIKFVKLHASNGYRKADNELRERAGAKPDGTFATMGQQSHYNLLHENMMKARTIASLGHNGLAFWHDGVLYVDGEPRRAQRRGKKGVAVDDVKRKLAVEYKRQVKARKAVVAAKPEKAPEPVETEENDCIYCVMLADVIDSDEEIDMTECPQCGKKVA